MATFLRFELFQDEFQHCGAIGTTTPSVNPDSHHITMQLDKSDQLALHRERPKLVYLYTELMPYQIRVFRELVERHGCDVHVFYWDTQGNTPYCPPEMDGVVFYKRSEYDSAESVNAIVSDLEPSLCYVTAWQDRGYLKACKSLVARGVPVVAGFDDIWEPTLRQRIGSAVVRTFGKSYFSHAWVSGPRQYEYAKRFGFSDDKILYYMFSGDSGLFSEGAGYLSEKAVAYPKTFLFVGRFAHAKAVDILVEGFRVYRTKYGGDWGLHCVGNGPLRTLLDDQVGIEVSDFQNQQGLLALARRCGAFVLPSRRDVSPLVVHEACSAGLPLILSRNIGNRLLFLIEGTNGFSFERESVEDLALKLHMLTSQSNEKLVEMGRQSARLSTQHDTRFVAASFLSLLSH